MKTIILSREQAETISQLLHESKEYILFPENRDSLDCKRLIPALNEMGEFLDKKLIELLP